MILEFKRKTELPKNIDLRIDKLTADYIGILVDACIQVGGENNTEEQYRKITCETIDIITKRLMNALDEL